MQDKIRILLPITLLDSVVASGIHHHYSRQINVTAAVLRTGQWCELLYRNLTVSMRKSLRVQRLNVISSADFNTTEGTLIWEMSINAKVSQEGNPLLLSPPVKISLLCIYGSLDKKESSTKKHRLITSMK